MAKRHKLKHASYLLLEKGGKVLLLRRFNTGYQDGKYTLPAGHVDEGEAFTETIIREANEEINIKLGKIEVVHVNHRPKANYLDIYFKAKSWKGKINNNEPEKCDDLRWFKRIPKDTLPHVKSVLKEIKKGRVYSEFI